MNNDIFKRVTVLFCLFGIFISISFAQEIKQPFALEIVPNERHKERSYIVFNKPHAPEKHFHVILTNISREPQKLFNESCSWGYGRLYFEVTDEKGKMKQVKKKEKIEWRKNYPDWFLLQPQEQVIFDVYFNPETWENSPRTEKGETSINIKIKAVYRLEEGEIFSPEYTDTIYHD